MEYITAMCNQEAEKIDLDLIMQKYGDAVLRMCYLYLKDKQLAEDVAQETFLKVYEKYDTFRNDSEEKTWIMRIAINLCKNQKRSNWFQKVLMGVKLETLEESDMTMGLIQEEEKCQLLREIYTLPDKYKEVVLLYYYQEINTREIAEILNIKEGTVRVRLQRAREKLSVNLQEVNHHERN